MVDIIDVALIYRGIFGVIALALMKREVSDARAAALF